jgi:hypothetical protein
VVRSGKLGSGTQLASVGLLTDETETPPA